MATYVNDLRLKEIGTGESSGTWGTETNVNLELIGEAMGYATKAVADASTSTITMPDGTATGGELRSLYLKLTGGGQASTVTLAPNTVSKVWFIENATSYTLTFTMGSGANVAVLAGQTKSIASDGAGSGAALYDVMTDLSVAGDFFVANTIQPAGDTASGDAAAFGYASADGAILTGQGSTSDVTLKNDADGTVLTIPTGTTNVDIVGTATAATFEPDGDTAAGDTAAIGYTSAEGLILTGQGSTNDVTIKNDADADVIEIPTGTTTVNFAGAVDVVGDLTAATFTPDGDTASGDAAAVGYTTAEGLILTGQGSASDVTLKNDADGTVLTIPTGTTNVDVVGDFTAGTLNADGDTAASDTAAIGYTSAEGIIVTGQGSASDVTLKNDADGTVLTIPTGTTNVDVVGDFTAGTLNADGDTAASDTAAIGYTSAEGIIVTGQGSASDVTLKNDADGTVLTIPTGTTNVDVVGDFTAGTLNADGDTSAGDTAAIGYTAVEGLILTGQGSTNDVTIKNDADADVIEIPTGTVNVTMAGTVTAASTLVGNAGLHVKNGATGAGFVQFFEDSDNGTNKVTLVGPASTADITLTLPSSTGSSGQAMVTDGSGVLSFAAVGGLYNDWAIKTGAYTMVSGDQIIVNASGATTITLPASSAAGATVTIKATGGGTVTIGRNSQNINSTAEDGTLSSGNATQLVFVDSTIGFLEL